MKLAYDPKTGVYQFEKNFTENITSFVAKKEGSKAVKKKYVYINEKKEGYYDRQQRLNSY